MQQRQYLINLRLKQNESQQDVADILNISRQYYCMIENGERQKRMEITLITELARHFNISPVDIIEFEKQWNEVKAKLPTTGREVNGGEP